MKPMGKNDGAQQGLWNVIKPPCTAESKDGQYQAAALNLQIVRVIINIPAKIIGKRRRVYGIPTKGRILFRTN